MPPEPPPLPIDATASTGTKLFTITFDRPLTPGPVSAGNWVAEANLTTGPRNWNPLAQPVATGSVVTFTGDDTGASLGGPTISFEPPPFDLLGVTGVPAAGFTDFPLSIIP